MNLSKPPFPLAARVRRVSPSATLALNQKAQQMRARGEDVVALTAGEPDAPTPAHVVEALARAARAGETRYTAVPGIPEVRDAVAERYREHGVHADRVILTAGGKQAIFNALLCLLEDGDQVLGFAPYWLSYRDMVALCGGEFVALPTDSNFLPQPEVLERAIGSQTRMVVLNSPSNPTGAVIPEGRMRALTEVLRRHSHVVLLFDEIYDRLVYPNARFVSPLEVAPDLLDRTILVNGGSKTYAMTGLRAGWAVAHPGLIESMSKVQGQSTSHCSAPVQRALQAALQGDQSFVQTMRTTLNRRRKALFEGLKHIPGVHCPEPLGAFYAFPSLGPKAVGESGQPDSAAVCQRLLDNQKLVVVPGEPFGAPGYVRLSFAVSDEVLAEALTRLKEGLA
jgi:aspartate aminotransferase